jgi:ATP-dependent helicase/nuclease subunit B
VDASPPNVRRHFLPWDRALLPQAAAWLAGDWRGDGPLDLGGTLIIVPTRQAGRRLREALAEFAFGRGHAVFAPRVMLPEELVAPREQAAPVASRIETQLAWISVLRELAPADFREVLPVDPPAQNFSWAARLANQFLLLQRTLAENALRFSDVVARAGADFPEAARWAQLAELESRYDATLASRGLRDPQREKIAAAKAPGLPAGIGRIVVFATPDPLPIAVEALARLAAQRPVEIVVFGARDDAAAFDGWGRPRDEAWARRALALEDFESHVHLCADPAEQAARAVACAKNYAAPEGRLALGLADAEIAPALEHGLREAGFAPFNPEGRPRRRDGFYALLAALAALVREPEFAAVATLARCPDFLAWLATRPEAGNFSAARALAALDELHARHLPATLAAAQAQAREARLAAVRPLLAGVEELRSTLTGGNFSASVTAALEKIFRGRQLARDAGIADAAGAWREVLCALARAAEKFPGLTAAEAWELALELFAEEKHSDDRPAGAIELLGWLELLWEDAPHLVVAGLNDGRVPEAVVGDAFLPEALRARLGLKTNAARLARDAYLLAALVASRAGNVAPGRLDLLFGKVSAAGDPLRPSRLLLRCPDAELPRRVEFLFRDAAIARPGPAWQRAWRLTPRTDAKIAALSVTSFADYLACPFRFYLRHGLGMEPVDPEKTELDAMDFGTLVHAALEQLGDEMTLRDCAEPETLRKFLLAELDHAARARFGAELTLPLVIQLESARQRLARAADVLAEQRAAGWAVERIEWKFPEAHLVGGLVLRGKIDRIERHAGTGRVRVLDFKTSDRPVRPRDAHCRRARADETAPEFARFTIGGEELVWIDLQLPLYLEAVAAEFGAGVTCGYFNLPKAVGETAVSEWEDFSAEWREAARRCAEGVAAAVAARIFWPPAEIDPRREDERFAGLFHQGTAASVEWRAAP